MLNKVILVFFLLIVNLLALPSYSWAQTNLEQSAKIQGVTIHADSIDRDTENDTVDLEGNVQVVFENQHLTCRKARINLRAKSIDASGQVVLTTPNATLSGNRIILDYENNTGLILNGFVQSGNVLFEGTQIQKINETTFIADDAHYTTCTTCPEAWSFSGSKIRAEIGGYAYIKNSFLHLGSFPVFWMPYLAVPLKSDRQSGVLTPGLEKSDSGGVAFAQSYFWAMSRSQDSTWTFKNYELRGLKGLLNYRYVLSENSKGELDTGFLRDRVFAESARLNKFRSNDQKNQLTDRWFLKYQHYYEMPDGIIHRAQVNNSSDLQYSTDFPLETLNYGDSAMENRTSVTKNTESQHLSVDSSYYKNLIQSNPLASNDDAVHRLPEFRFSQADTKIGQSEFLYAFDLDYANFARENFAYDDLNAAYDPKSNSNSRHIVATGGANCSSATWEQNPECKQLRDGLYEPKKDLIRTGQRLDLKPTIYRPMKIQNFDILPRLTYRETQYTFPVSDNTHATRRSIRADISSKTSFTHIYGDFSKLQSERFKHEIQPEIKATSIPWIDQPKHEFFGEQSEDLPFLSQDSISDADLNGPAGIQFDYNDRVYDRKIVTLGLTNKITRKTWSDGTPNYLQFVVWKLAQSYDVYQAERNPNSQPLSDLLSDLKVDLSNFQIYQQANYYPYQHVTNTSTRVRLNNDRADFFQTEHIQSYNISPGKEDPGDRKEQFTFSVKKNVSWLDLVGKLSYDMRPQNNQENVQSWGYGARIKFPGDCLFFNIMNYRVAGGDTNFKFNVAFIWDGEQKAPLSETIISQFGF